VSTPYQHPVAMYDYFSNFSLTRCKKDFDFTSKTTSN
jgi:hypothetical protein